MFSVGSTVSLSDGNKYIVTGNACVNNKVYYSLVSAADANTIKFCTEKQQNNKIYMKEFEDLEVIKKLHPYFKKSMEDFLKNNPDV